MLITFYTFHFTEGLSSDCFKVNATTLERVKSEICKREGYLAYLRSHARTHRHAYLELKKLIPKEDEALKCVYVQSCTLELESDSVDPKEVTPILKNIVASYQVHVAEVKEEGVPYRKATCVTKCVEFGPSYSIKLDPIYIEECTMEILEEE